MSAGPAPQRATPKPAFSGGVDGALVSIEAVLDDLRSGHSLGSVRAVACGALHVIRERAAYVGFDELGGYLAQVIERIEAPEESQTDQHEVAFHLQAVAEMTRDWSRSLRKAGPFVGTRFTSLPRTERDPQTRSGGTPPEASGSLDEAFDAFPVPAEMVGQLFRHLMGLEMARTRLQYRLGRTHFDPDLDQLESHSRALRDLLVQLPGKMPKAFFEAQIVQASGERFALPLSSIVEGHLASRARVTSQPDGCTAFDREGQQIPVVELASYIDGLESAPGRFLLVIDPQLEGGDHEAFPVALSVEAVEDAEIISNSDPGRQDEIVPCEVTLASGDRARVVDVEVLHAVIADDLRRACLPDIQASPADSRFSASATR